MPQWISAGCSGEIAVVQSFPNRHKGIDLSSAQMKETLENQAILRGNVGVIAGGTDLGVKQFGFGDHEQSTAKTRTRRQRLLAEMESVVPWQALIDLIASYYPKPNRKAGRPPCPIET